MYMNFLTNHLKSQNQFDNIVTGIYNFHCACPYSKPRQWLFELCIGLQLSKVLFRVEVRVKVRRMP